MLINIMMYMCIFFVCLLIMNFTMKMIDVMIILKWILCQKISQLQWWYDILI